MAEIKPYVQKPHTIMAWTSAGLMGALVIYVTAIGETLAGAPVEAAAAMAAPALGVSIVGIGLGLASIALILDEGLTVRWRKWRAKKALEP